MPFLRTPDRFRSEWLCAVADIIGAGKLFQKRENDDTGIDLNIVRTGKIGVKGLVVENGQESVLSDRFYSFSSRRVGI